MSIPREEREALIMGWDFLFEVTSPENKKKIPKTFRDKAMRILRHYPGPTAIELFYKRNEI